MTAAPHFPGRPTMVPYTPRSVARTPEPRLVDEGEWAPSNVSSHFIYGAGMFLLGWLGHWAWVMA